MPHSSGGGRSGGGFHGGSHGGYGHSGGASDRFHFSRSHFPGARRYVYYSRFRHHERIIYTDNPYDEEAPLKAITCWIAIDDRLGILNDDRINMQKELVDFQKKTGITPVILTIS